MTQPDYFAILPIHSAEALDDPGEIASALLRAAHSGGIGVFVWDIAGGRVLWNDTMFDVYGIDRGSFNKQVGSWLTTLHPDDLPRVREEVMAALRGEKPYDTQFRACGGVGQGWRYIKANAWIERDATGQAIRMAGINQDITDSHRYQTLVDAIARDTSDHVGHAFLQALTRALADTLGVRHAFIAEVYPREAPTHARMVARWVDGSPADDMSYALANTPCADVVKGEPQRYADDVRKAFPDDTLLATMGARSLLGVPLRASDGGVLGLLEVIDDKPAADIALAHKLLELFAGRAGAELERVLRDEEVGRLNVELEARVAARTLDLKRTMRELEAFTYSVSHDLGIPLRAVQGFASILHDDYAAKLDAAGRDYLARTLAASDRMSRLLEDLVSLSKISLRALNVTKTDLSLTANGVVADLQAQKPRPAMQFICSPHMIIHADAGLMRILLDCLLRNSWKFTEMTRGPCIELFDREVDGRREIVLRDNGVGFDAATAAKLFTPFQGDGAGKTNSGSGLMIAQRIIHRHHGNIRAESEPGKGATFVFWLPPASELMDLLGSEAN